MDSNKKNILLFDSIWNFFSSIRLSVITLLLLALTSIIGTLIPQNQMADFYQHKYSEAVYKILTAINVFDMYHSWWFQFLILILAINIIICSLDRFPSIWKIVRKKPVFNIDRFRRYKRVEEINLEESFTGTEEKYKSIFKKKFGKFTFEPAENAFYLFGEKGRWTRLGVYIVHASILLLLFGGMLGSINGFEGNMNVSEGESEDIVTIKETHGHVKLDFQIRCDKFEMSLYDNGAPKEYKSDLTIIENGKEILKKSIIVNDPLRYKGINIFQSSYGSIPANNVTLNFKSKESGMVYEKEAKVGKEIELPENLGKFTLKGFVPSYNFRNHNIGETFVGVIIKPDGKERTVLMPLQYEVFDEMFKPDIAVKVLDYKKKFYTGLQITKDPGVIFVYAGFLFMIIGCYIAFFMSHESLCIEVTQSGEQKHRVRISGSANKNRISLKVKISKIAAFIKNS